MKQLVYGTLPTGEVVDKYILSNEEGMEVHIITYGGIITELHVPDPKGHVADVMLGLKSLEDYLAGHPYFGAITGRVAGRISQGKFDVDGKAYALVINDPPNHLHGGLVGLDKRLWKGQPAPHQGAESVRLTYRSPDGEEGYPGTVDIAVTYTLTQSNKLVIEYDAVTDQSTPFSPTNHAYFHLGGEGSGTVEDHHVQIFTDTYVPTDRTMTLSSRAESVEGKPNDFRTPRRLGDVLDQLHMRHGDNYVIQRHTSATPVPMACVSHPESGRVMRVSSTETTLQFYSGSHLDGTTTGKSGVVYGPHMGVCFECQGYPDGVMHPAFGSILLTPGHRYRQTTVYAFEGER